MIGVILPSRGLIFSQTADELLQNLKGIPHKFFFAHRLGIPECFETPTNQALADPDITRLWLVEDDMILPQGTLKQMLELDKAVVTMDYPVTKEGKGAVFSVKDEVVFCGTGCTLVAREVFEELKKPYFTTEFVWNIKNYGDHVRMTAIKHNTKDNYGLHDVNFCMSLYKRNIPIHVAGNIGQRKLVELGKQGSNNGAHVIEEWNKVKKDFVLKQVKKWPVEQSGKLVTVLTPTGEINCSAEHAKKLIRNGLATRPPKKAVVVDDSAL